MPSNKRRKRGYAVSISGFFIALAALGLITVIYLSLRLTSTVLDNSSEKLMFENIVRPVVMFNPPPFESPTDIEPKNLLQYSMWSTLMGEKRDTYQFGDNGELIVPASDLDVAAARLFGDEVKLEHQSFGEVDMFYFYDEANLVYNVPVSIQLNVYTPKVEEITKKGEFYELSVGYIPSGISWQTDYSGGKGEPEPEKSMNYIMKKTKDSYSIAKVQDPVSVAGQINTPQQHIQSVPEDASSAE